MQGESSSAEALCDSEADDTKISDSLPIARLLVELDEQWPSLKFLGFGCYYAWIWLCYNSSILVARVADQAVASDAVFAMYLLSTTSLAVTLLVSSLFAKKSSKLVNSKLFVLGASFVVAMSTMLVAVFSAQGAQSASFIITAAMTGVGTAWIALRLGSVYATVPARQAVMYTTASFVFACMLYFVAVGLPANLGLAFTASLPVLAAAFTMSMSVSAVAAEGPHPRGQSLPKGFFLRLVAMITVFSVVVGVTRGFSTLKQSVESLNSEGAIIVFGMAAVAAVIFLVVGSTVRNFDISRLYYPAIIVAAAGILVMPLFGGTTGGSGSFENQVIGIAYAAFIMVIWCLLSHVSYMTGMSSAKVFGWGRGASAAGTTIGWLLGSLLIERTNADPSFIFGVSVAMVFILFVMAMLVFNDRTIGQVLKRSYENTASADSERIGDLFPTEMLSEQSASALPEGQRKEGSWRKRCNEIAEIYKLSPRECDVLLLLAKGRTIEYISQDLGISFNTAKSHIRNTYIKIGVHTRQELLNLIEQNR